MSFIVKLKDKSFSIINNVYLFTCTYFILSFISFIPILRQNLGFLNKFILVWGAYLILVKILVKKEYSRKSGIFMLILLIASYLISIFINYKYNLFHNILNLGYMVLNLIILMGVTPKKKTAEETIKEFKGLNNLLIILMFIATVVSIVMFIFAIKFKLSVDGSRINQGFIYNRLNGIYLSVNVGAILSSFAIALSLINFYLTSKTNKKLRIFYIVTIVFQAIYLVLSDSRGAFIGAVALFLTYAFLYLFRGIKSKEMKPIKAAVLLVLCIGLSAGSYYALNPLKKVFAIVPNLIANLDIDMKQRIEKDDNFLWPHKSLSDLLYYGPFDNAQTFLLRDEKEEDDPNQAINNLVYDVQIDPGRSEYDFMGSRMDIWTSQLKAFKTAPIFGLATTDMNDNESVILNTPGLSEKEEKELGRVAGNTHNSYIQILVTGGICAFILFMAFIIFIMLKSLNILFFKKINKNYFMILAVVFAIMVSNLVTSIVESHILFRYSDFLGVVSWIYMGYMFRFINLFKQDFDIKKDPAYDVYICATPYHILSSINKIKTENNRNKKYSIILSPDFDGIYDIAKKLEKLNLFDEVNVLKHTNASYTKTKSFLKLLFGNRNLKKYIKNKKISNLYYCFTNPIIFTLAYEYAAEYNNEINAYFIEDGLVSYISYLERMTGLMRLFYKILSVTPMSESCDGVYLYNPKLLKIEIKPDVLQLPLLSNLQNDKKFLLKINDVFGYKYDKKYDSEAVYLSQPLIEDKANLPEFDKFMKLEKEFLAEAKNKYKTFAIKLHPRSVDNKRYDGFDLIKSAVPFELVAINQPFDSRELITLFSSAAITPKLVLGQDVKTTFLLRGSDSFNL